MKCEIGLEIACPICAQSRDGIHALKYHLKVAHKKNKREIDDLVELGTMEPIEPKRQKLSFSTPQSSSSRKKSSDQIKSESAQKPHQTRPKSPTLVQAPILPSTMVEDESHFLLSRSIQVPINVKKEEEAEQKPGSSKSEKKSYVCLCGSRFDDGMSLAVHCHMVGHKFAEFIMEGADAANERLKDRMKIIKVQLPIICYACPRTSKHNDLGAFITHILSQHHFAKSGKKSSRRSKNTLTESDIRMAVTRYPPTFMDTIPPNIRCIQCAENERQEDYEGGNNKKQKKPMKKLAELKVHIQKHHTQIPKWRCIFCQGGLSEKERFFSSKRERMYQHINAEHGNVRQNGETDKSLLDSCLVDSSLLWKCYGINEK